MHSGEFDKVDKRTHARTHGLAHTGITKGCHAGIGLIASRPIFGLGLEGPAALALALKVVA